MYTPRITCSQARSQAEHDSTIRVLSGSRQITPVAKHHPSFSASHIPRRVPTTEYTPSPLPTLAEELPGAFPETGDDPSGDEPNGDSDNGDDGGNHEPLLPSETPVNPEENPLQALANAITEFSHATHVTILDLNVTQPYFTRLRFCIYLNVT